MSPRFSLILSWLVTILTPLAIIMIGVRLLLTPVFPEIEYRLPGFPVDSYGFTLQDRLTWSKPSIEYLINSADIGFLAGLQFDDGQMIYNERELSHMSDVKKVVQMLLKLWYVDLVLLILLGVWAWRAGWLDAFRAGLRRGGFLIVSLLVVLGTFAATSFWQFFEWFHGLFFSGDSWLFQFSDTLIRLFPIRFWEDAVVFIVGLAILIGLALGFGLKPKAQ
jgi:integral membrane protein (TIGR01906 family)